MSNCQISGIHREIDFQSGNVINYLKCLMCNEKETYIGKTIGDNTKGFKVRVKQGSRQVSSHIKYTIVVLK